MSVEVRTALPADTAELRALYRRSAVTNDGGRRALAARPDLVEPSDADLRAGRVRAALLDGRLVGFTVVVPGPADAAELDAVFVDPDHMGRGIGRLLLDDAIAVARASGATALEVTANPAAVAFYVRAGFVRDGPVPTEFGPAERMHRPLRDPGPQPGAVNPR